MKKTNAHSMDFFAKRIFATAGAAVKEGVAAKTAAHDARDTAVHSKRVRINMGGAVLAALLIGGCSSTPTPSNISIGEALAVPDDSKVVVTGQVVQQIDSDHYLLRDSTGSITAHIEESTMGKVKVAPDARLRIGGTVDQDHKPPLLEAKTVQLVQ